MAIVSSYDWESDSWTQHNGENGAAQVRDIWRKAVESVATKAREVLPASVHGRIDRAVQIVLNGDVELLPDDRAKVGSQSNGVTKYYVVDGTCECRDFEKAWDHWCKHRLAYGIYKRAKVLAKEQLKALDAPTIKSDTAIPPVEAPVESEPTTPPVEIPPQSEQAITPVTHSEAPASCNTYVTIAGRKVQVTLRDSDEQRLLNRLEALLDRFPVEEESEPEANSTPPENWCPIHQVFMKRYSNAKGSWFSHKTPEGTWCNGKKGK